MHLDSSRFRSVSLITAAAALALALGLLSACAPTTGGTGATTDGAITPVPPTVTATAASGGGGGEGTIVQRHAPQIAIAAGTAAGSKASCNQGELMVGGGYYIAAGFPALAVNSYPAGASDWVANVANPSNQPIYITAFADCLQTKTPVTVTLVRGAPLSDSSAPSFAGSVATCPAGTILTGGGYNVTPGFSGADHLYGLAPDGLDWKVKGQFPGHSVTVIAYALCATHLAAAPNVTFALPIPGSTPAGANTANCAASALLTSGGFEGSDSDNMLYSIDSPDSVTAPSPGLITHWTLGGQNRDTTAHTVTIVGICVKIVP